MHCRYSSHVWTSAKVTVSLSDINFVSFIETDEINAT